MQKAITISRILLGLMLVIFGLNGFLHFIPLPEMTESADSFMAALTATGYMMPIVKGLEVIIGIGLLANFRTPLLLILVTPIMLNAFLFHLVLDPAGMGGSVLALGLNIFLLFAYKETYKPVLAAA